jgi:F-type H+-transporting ATPase subunit b
MLFARPLNDKFFRAAKISGFFSVFLPSAVWASAATAGQHAPPGIESLFWPVVNFVLYLFVLRWGYGAAVRPLLRDRSIQLERDLQQAANLLSDAERQRDALSQRLAAVESEQQELRERLKRDGEHLAQLVIGKAQEAARQLEREILRRIDAERAKAVAEIRREVVFAATGLARERLAVRLGAEDDVRLRQITLRTML